MNECPWKDVFLFISLLLCVLSFDFLVHVQFVKYIVIQVINYEGSFLVVGSPFFQVGSGMFFLQLHYCYTCDGLKR